MKKSRKKRQDGQGNKAASFAYYVVMIAVIAFLSCVIAGCIVYGAKIEHTEEIEIVRR